MIVLSTSNISKSYIVDEILNDVSFTVTDKDKIGIIGNNGSGKTTLLKIISGDEKPSSGQIYIRKDLKIGYLEQHTNIQSSQTLFEECMDVFQDLIDIEKNIRDLENQISLEKEDSPNLEVLMNKYSNLSEEFSNKNGYAIESNIRGTLKGLGFSNEEIYRPVETLSGGQKSRLSLAKLLLSNPDILLLDEPTNHLDINAINWLEIFLNEYQGAVLIISHDRYFLDNVVNKIFLIEHKHLKIYNSNYNKYIKQRKIDLDLERKQYNDQQKEISRQKEIIERFSNYGDRRYIKQAQARQKLLDKMEKLDAPTESFKTSIKFEPSIKSGRDVLEVKNISKSFPNKTLFENINFNIYRGERVGLIGSNGIGKTTLFKIIMDQMDFNSGEINLGHKVNIGYFDQEQENLNLENTIVDEIWDEHPNFTHYDLRSILSKFLFLGDDIFKEISDLSGGERGRLSLLKIMLSKANFLLMDEPTNHLDIDSKEVLEDALLDYDGTLLVISHDRYFLNKVTDRIIELTPDSALEYLGNYDYYIQKKKELDLPTLEEDTRTKTQIKSEKKKLKEKELEERKLQKEIKLIETDISTLEEELENLDQLLCSPEIYDDSEKVLEITRAREDVDVKLNKLYTIWSDMV